MAQKGWPPTEDFADRLARLRRHRGVDNAAIADGAGVSVKTVSHWIGGQMPETGALLKLARFFDVSPNWLLEGEGEPAAQAVPPAAKKKPGRYRDLSTPKKPGRGERAS